MNIRRFLPHAIALGGFALLAGCVSAGPPGIPLAQRAPLKGRAFKVGSITFTRNVHPKGDPTQHCLPDKMYAEMLRHEMVVAFRHAHLGQGVGPAVPVSLVIRFREFGNNVISGTGIIGNVHLGPAVGKHLDITDGFYRKDLNLGHYWMRQQHIIPTVALAMTNGTKAVQQGRNFDQQGQMYNGAADVDYWHYFGVSAPTDGLHQTLTQQQVEADTGKTAQQLAAICRADIRAGR